MNFYGVEKGERTGRANEKKKEKRNEEIFRKWNCGFTVEQLSKKYNLCSETIGKILTKKGVSGIDRIKRSAGKYHTKKIYQFLKRKNILVHTIPFKRQKKSPEFLIVISSRYATEGEKQQAGLFGNMN